MQDQWMHRRLCSKMVTLSTFGQQTQALHGGKQI
jgi:hypothetical protein